MLQNEEFCSIPFFVLRCFAEGVDEGEKKKADSALPERIPAYYIP